MDLLDNPRVSLPTVFFWVLHTNSVQKIFIHVSCVDLIWIRLSE
jgi:hypothetical protein